MYFIVGSEAIRILLLMRKKLDIKKKKSLSKYLRSYYPSAGLAENSIKNKMFHAHAL